MGRVRLWLLVLQSCRPYPGAVIVLPSRQTFADSILQSCRPYSGAVIPKYARRYRSFL